MNFKSYKNILIEKNYFAAIFFRLISFNKERVKPNYRLSVWLYLLRLN